jgi:hypothetical protein
MEFVWTKEPAEKIRFLAPKGWIHREREDRLFLSMHRPGYEGRERIFMEIVSPREMQNGDPEKTIARMLDLSARSLESSARKRGDKATRLQAPSIYRDGGHLVGHQVIHYQGAREYTQSITFLYNGKKLYAFRAVMEPEDMTLGEFLSELFVESFCRK